MTKTIRATLHIESDGGFAFHFHDPLTLLPGQAYDVTLQPRADLCALRRLRLHHWREACKLADSLATGRGTEQGRENWRRRHAEHMAAVEALNALFPSEDTPERDAASIL